MPKGEKRLWTKEKIDLAIYLYKQGLSLHEVGRRVGGKKSTVKKYIQLAGIDIRPLAHYSQGSLNQQWKGGVTIDNDGYVLVYSPDHPYKNNSNKVRLHRLIIEKKLGRYLLPTEVVDHINNIKDDNRLENLRLFEKNADHLRTTLKGHVPKWSEEGRKKIFSTVGEAWTIHYRKCPKKTCEHRLLIAKNRLKKKLSTSSL